MTRAYGAATAHTGQSDPIINRLAPKHSKATSKYGRKSAGFQACQSASVTRPDTLHETLGNAAISRIPRAQTSRAPLLIGGFAIWSRTNLCRGNRATNSVATGRCRV